MSTLSKKKVIAITGSMGSGKSMVSSILKESFPVTDCDAINRQLLEKDNEGYNALLQKDYIQLTENKEIDKVHMATVVFTNPDKKKEVESILHPLIFKKMHEWIEKQEASVLFVEVPILFEIQAQDQFDEVWCVVCSQDVALYRLQMYRHITKEQAIMRLQTQMSPALKMEKSDVVIYNDGTIDDLRKTIQEEIKKGEIRWI